jgi:hypothetical protein
VPLFITAFILTSVTGCLAAGEILKLKKLAAFEIIENKGAPITAGKEKAEFFPQSFSVKDGFIYAINRYEPLLVIFNAAGEPSEIIKLKHDADKKFDARFFIDITFDKNDAIYLLEQSTATIRKTSKSGIIEESWPLTFKEGAIVQRAWKMPGNFFFAYDKGLNNAYIRDITYKNIKDEPDKAGSEFICETESLIYSDLKLIMTDKTKDGFEALITPAGNSDDIKSMKKWENAEKVIALDADSSQNYYFYTETKNAASIDVISEINNKFEVKSFAVEKIEFLNDASKHCSVFEAGRLLILHTDNKNAYFSEIKLELK